MGLCYSELDIAKNFFPRPQGRNELIEKKKPYYTCPCLKKGVTPTVLVGDT